MTPKNIPQNLVRLSLAKQAIGILLHRAIINTGNYVMLELDVYSSKLKSVPVWILRI
jgi:hypothetical protein